MSATPDTTPPPRPSRQLARVPIQVTSLLGNAQALDGGAMFGNAPKAVWSRWLAPDDENRVRLACRAMLIEAEGRQILCETGIGAFFPPELRQRYGVVEDRHVLLDSLAAVGLSDADIDVVVLSHLHFDHAGGLLAPWEAGQPRLLFPRAEFVVGRAAWERARHPHARDRASFIPELPALLEATGRLRVVEEAAPLRAPQAPAVGHGSLRFYTSDGHTPGLLLTEVELPDGPVVFAADLIPGAAWVHAPITMGYDRFPELLIDEKTALLASLAERRGRLFFTHDPDVAMARVERDGKGRFVPVDPQRSLAGWAA